MGFLICGFTSSRYGCIVEWILSIFDSAATMFVMFSYMFFWIFVLTGYEELRIRYYALIGALIHLCVSMMLLLTDIIFKSDIMTFGGQSEPNIGNVMTITSFGSFETIPQFEIENKDRYNCFKQNPWALYRKHYMITGIRLSMLIMDIAVLIVLNDGWKCATNKC